MLEGHSCRVLHAVGNRHFRRKNMQNQSNSQDISASGTQLPMTNGSAMPTLISDSGGQAAIIGKSLVIKGEVTGSESLYVDGKVEGSINLPGNRVTIGRNGQVAASITAREVVVQGKVVGNITVSDRLDVRNEGSLTGDVVAHRISVEDGAFFKGKIDIRRPTEKLSFGAETREEKASEPASAKIVS
jgi:cytoskeletal protein CcmA (bactofilin family)